MAQVLVRDLDQGIVKRLKDRAKHNGRSLQAEVKQVLVEAAGQPTLDMVSARRMADEICDSLGDRRFDDCVKIIREGRKR